jgi:hypothetical protein
VLKRKRPVVDDDPDAKLRQKVQAASGRDAAEDDVVILKAKLKAKLAEAPAKPRAKPRTKSARRQAPTKSVRGQTAQAALAPAPAPPAPVARTCRIGWWRGTLKSMFYVELGAGGRGGRLLLCSPAFRWHSRNPPPPDLQAAAEAHAALLADVEAAGWVATGRRRGEEWYALELQYRPQQTSRM